MSSMEDRNALKGWFHFLLSFVPREFVKSELLSRKLSHNCAKKITFLVNETDAITQPNSIADQNGNQPHHPVMAAFIELMEDPYLRFIIFGFSSIIQMVTLECPSALVWNYFGENKTPSSLLASPLDFLPNCTPSGLPMPRSQNNAITRQKIKRMETMIKQRSISAEGRRKGKKRKSPHSFIDVVCFSFLCQPSGPVTKVWTATSGT